MEPSEVDYVNAHGTSTPLNDTYEIQALRRVFGDAIGRVSISSTKSMTGHMLGAAGAAEAAFCVMAITDGVVPPTINLDHPDDEFSGLDLVPHRSRRREVRAAMTNTFGFGGANAVLIFKRFEE